MARYLICDREVFNQSILSEQRTSDPRAAIEAVDAGVTLPERVVVIQGNDLTPLYVLDAGDSVESAVVRGGGGVSEYKLPPLDAPGGFSAKATSAGTRVNLTWSAVDGAAGYKIYRDGQWMGSIPGSQTAIADTTIAPNQQHDYAVATLNSDGIEGTTTPVVHASTVPTA